jgi:hypothetical protein
MAREQLQALAVDVRRLLAVGGAAAAGDERLRQRAGALRELAQKVPALAPVAQAVERVVGAGPERAAAALLELTALLRPVCGALALHGGAGELTEIGPGGPWASDLPVAAARDVAEALQARGEVRLQKVCDALGGRLRPDLRLVGPLLDVFGERSAAVAAEVARRAPTLLGPASLPELRAGLDFRGQAGPAQRLMAICHLDNAAGLDLCRQAFREGGPALRLAAVAGVAVAAPEQAEALLVERVYAETNSEVRQALVAALGRLAGTTGNAIPVLAALLGDAKAGLGPHAAQALARIGRPAVPALAAALRANGGGTWAATALECIGQAAAEAVPALLDYLRGLKARGLSGVTAADFCSGARALRAVAPRLPPESVPLLIDVVRVGRFKWEEAAEALSLLAPNDREAAAAVAETFTRPNLPAAQQTAAVALGRFGAAAVAAVPALLRMLADRAAEQWAAAEALKQIGPHAPAAVVPGVVEALLREDNYHLRTRMLAILERIGPRAREAELALSLLAESDENETVRAAAARVLKVVQGGPAAA